MTLLTTTSILFSITISLLFIVLTRARHFIFAGVASVVAAILFQCFNYANPLDLSITALIQILGFYFAFSLLIYLAAAASVIAFMSRRMHGSFSNKQIAVRLCVVSGLITVAVLTYVAGLATNPLMGSLQPSLYSPTQVTHVHHPTSHDTHNPNLAPMPGPSTGVHPAEIWLPRALTNDEKGKRVLADTVLYTSKRLNDEAAANVQRLQWELLKHQYDVVEAQLNAILDKSSADPSYYLVEMNLSDVADAGLPGVAKLNKVALDEWVSARPHSPWSHFSEGLSLLQSAWDARGEHFAQDVTSHQWQKMHEYASKGRIELKRSLKLNPKLAQAWAMLLEVDKMDGDSNDVNRDYRDAEKRGPMSMLITNQYFNALEPRWGGSYKEMDAFARSKATLLRLNPLFWALGSYAPADKGYAAVNEHCTPCSYHQWELSLKYYNEALGYVDYTDWLSRAGDAAAHIHRYGLAYKYYERASKYSPKDFTFVMKKDLMQALCSPNYKKEYFEVLRQGAETYAGVPAMEYPRSSADCKYYQTELPWADEPIPNPGVIAAYLIDTATSTAHTH